MSETLLRFALRTILIKNDKEVNELWRSCGLGQFLQINLPSAALLRLDAVHVYVPNMYVPTTLLHTHIYIHTYKDT